MSKKKSSTMTLRDFHGGSIPSDLPLPSAPGMTAERRNHDRPGSGGWMGSSLNRGYSGERAGFARQTSGTFARSYEEKVSYMPNPANIGRNYDEDERKPVYGHAGRAQGADLSDEQLHDQRYVGHERVTERYSLDSRGSYTHGKYTDTKTSRPTQEDFVSMSLNPQSENYARCSPHLQEPLPVRSVSFQDQVGYIHSQPHISGSHSTSYQEPVLPWRQDSFDHEPGTVIGSSPGLQNVWTARRESDNSTTYAAEYSVNESSSDIRARISQASASEKVSSGRWNAQVSPSINEPSQVYAGDYGRTFASPNEGNSQFYARSPADIERSPFNDDPRNEFSRATFRESGRAMNAPSFRDARFELQKASPHDPRWELVGEGKGSESGRFVDDRYGYTESGWRGVTTPRDPARYSGAIEQYEGGPLRGSKDVAGLTGNDVLYTDARNKSPSNTAWMGPNPSPRREYGEGKNANFQTRKDAGGVDGEQRSWSFEGQRSPQFDAPYQSHGKEEGQMPARHLKGRGHDAPEPGRGGPESARGRYNDWNRGPVGPDVQQSQAANLLETGGSMMTTEYEGMNAPVERPKLKLLPRTRPVDVEPMEEPCQEKVYEKVETTLSRPEGAMGSGSLETAATTGGGSSEEPRMSERPKLSLKPRSQPVDGMPLGSGSVKERMSVFGGARPRELVLKERGVGESPMLGTEGVLTPGASSVSTPIGANRPSSGGSNYGGKKQEKQEDKKFDGKATDKHENSIIKPLGRQESGRLERNESHGRKDFVEFEKKERYPQEKAESERPDVDKQDSWRRPVEVQQSPMIPSAGGRSIHSAVELAQAFSRSTSFGSSQARSVPGNLVQRASMARSPGAGFVDPRRTTSNDVPFSRLTEAPSPLPRDYQSGYRGTSAF